MATPTEKLLGNLLSSSKRIEQLLEKKDSKKKDDKDEAVITAEVVGGITSNMKEMTKSVKNIEKESKKTNELLEKLIKVNTKSDEAVFDEADTIVKSVSNLGIGINRLIRLVRRVGNLPDKSVDRFKEIVMVSAFLDPKTGQPFATEKHFKQAAEASQSIINISKGIAFMGLTMVGFAIMLPAITVGYLGLRMVVGGITSTVKRVHKALDGKDYLWGDEKKPSPINTIKTLMKLVSHVGIIMAAFSVGLPLIMTGFIGLTAVIAGISLTISLVHRAIGGKDVLWGNEKKASPINTVRVLMRTVAFTGITMAAFAVGLPLIMAGFIGLTAVIAGISLTIWLTHKLLGKDKGGLKGLAGIAGGMTNGKGAKEGIKDSEKSKGPLASLSKLLLGVVFTSIVLIGAGFFAKQLALGALVISLSITGIGLSLRLISGDNARQGANNLIRISGALAIFAGSLALYAHLAAGKLGWNDLAILGATIAGVSLIATVLGIPPIAAFAETGSKALIAIGGALAIFSVGIFIFSKSLGPIDKFGGKRFLMLMRGVIGGVSLIATVLGIPPIAEFALLGSVALIAIGGALSVFSIGLGKFVLSGFDETHINPLTGSIVAVSRVASLLGAFSIFAILGATALTAIGDALIPFTIGLKKYTEVDWSEDKSKNLKSAIGGVTNAIDSIGFIKMARVGLKARMIRNLGETLTGLAKGIQSFANLTFDTYELDDDTGEMKLKERVNLTPVDIAKTGVVIGMVLEALVDPIIKFGGAMSGAGGGGLFSWGKNDVERGIDSFGVIGSGLVNLATGVQDWANMTITEYDIQKNSQTGLNEIVPIKKRPLEEGELEDAGEAIASVLTALVDPVVKFGEAMSGSGGGGLFGWGKNDIERGMESFGTLSDGLGNLAEGIVAWSRMEYFEQEVVKDPETGLNVIQPKDKSPKPIDIPAATKNITKVLNALPEPLIKFGNKLTEGWGDPAILAIENLSEMSGGLGSLAEVISNWSFMSYTKMKVDKDGNLVPDEVVEINDIGKARKNIVSALTTLTAPLIGVSNVIEKHGGVFKFMQTLSSMSQINETFGEIAKNIENIWGNDSTVSAGKQFRNWVTNIAGASVRSFSFDLRAMASGIGLLDNSLTKMFGMEFDNGEQPFDKFTNNIIKLSYVAKDFEKFVDSFDRMAISMGVFAENFNMMDVRGITAFGVWTDTLTKAVEIGKEAEQGMFDNFLDSAKATVENAFSLGDSLFGSDSNAMTKDEKQSVIDKTLNEEGPDPTAQKLEALDATLRALSGEINTLKAVMSGTLDVNISGVDNSAARKIRD